MDRALSAKLFVMSTITINATLTTEQVDAIAKAKEILSEHYGYNALNTQLDSLWHVLASAMLNTIPEKPFPAMLIPEHQWNDGDLKETLTSVTVVHNPIQLQREAHVIERFVQVPFASVLKTILLVVVMALTAPTMAQDKTPCKGITKKNEPCKASAMANTGYCRFHDPNAVHCGAPTAKKQPCKMVVAAVGAKCWRHKES